MLKIFRFRGVLSKCQPVRFYGVQINQNIDLKKAIESMACVKQPGQPPKVWQLLEKVGKDGKPLKFTIQEIPEDRYEEAIQYLCKNLVAKEPITKYWNPKNDPLILTDLCTLWTILFTQNISIAAFIDNPNGGKPIIAGINVLGVSIKGHKDGISEYKFMSPISKNIFELINGPTKIIYERYEVNKYINGIALSVGPIYREYGLIVDFLKIRDQIAREYDIPAATATFTSKILQKMAMNVGFETLVERKFADIVDKNGKQQYSGIKIESLITMGKKFS
ncbi:uncharacterized protein [Linepithema humile]|uniref:uncharacterized protein n=1 Tax=Linepithema humile TaxID=83485 RepID=UPI00062350BF|nr:PREDICTED: uncharacterized protein LOC105671858 isoform X1 [Linepithema humile]XP_012221783.1 PREDICTED: uncharacterized protein LOC105671858 isoform X2 [Linepithema humile]